MKLYKKIPLLALFVLFIASCSALKDLASVQKPKLSVADAKISDASLTDLELTFDVEVDNPNAVSINLASYNYDFLISDRTFVNGNQSLGTTILSNNKSIVQIPVRFTYEDLFKTFSDIRDKDETNYELKSVIGVDLPVLGFTEIPLEKSGTFPVIKKPTVSASRLTVKNISFTNADLELVLNIENPNAFGISLKDTDYSISINGLKSISGKSLNPIVIKEKNSGTITVPVSLNFIQLGRSAYNLITSDQPMEYTLSGSTEIESPLPFFKTSSYNFDRSGNVNIFNN
jgi:LEA14-like dessication related protein